jgi:S-DNA-T family DNA segregation ATPase FtsK/SpoIIIE
MNGAERLLGKGDMLFVPPGTSAPVRIHGAFVSEDEIRNLVEHWKEQGPADFREDLFVQAESKESGGDEGDQEYDERYDDAVALVARTGEASISLIQRHLRIGYNRAARLIEQMETEGVVGPAEGSKRRQVMIRNIPSPDVESIDAS